MFYTDSSCVNTLNKSWLRGHNKGGGREQNNEISKVVHSTPTPEIGNQLNGKINKTFCVKIDAAEE